MLNASTDKYSQSVLATVSTVDGGTKVILSSHYSHDIDLKDKTIKNQKNKRIDAPARCIRKSATSLMLTP